MGKSLTSSLRTNFESYRGLPLYFALIVYVAGIVFVCTFPEQSDFIHILLGVTLAFAGYSFLIRFTDVPFKTLLIAGVGVRLILLFTFPNLSDDVYRFFWDGKMWWYGENAYAILPSEYITAAADNRVLSEVFAQLNSPQYYTVYPPVAQLIFWAGAITDNVFISSVIMKIFLLIGEFFGLKYILQLAELSGLPKKITLWYFLNPLVIIEGSGNLHFEVLMVAFLAVGLFYLYMNKTTNAAIFTALSVSVKLFPLIFLPFIFFKLPSYKRYAFSAIIFVIIVILFFPLWYSVNIGNFAESINLYFRKFEFNASVYFVFRSLGIWLSGYNLIAVTGPLLALIVFLLVSGKVWKSKKSNIHDFWKFALYAWTVYLVLSTTIHPWYLILLVFMGIFAMAHFTWIWSYLVFLSYAHYAYPDGIPDMVLLAEYGIVALAIFLQYSAIGQSIGQFILSKR